MPDILRLLPEIIGDSIECVVIAIAAWKDDDAKFHDECFGEAQSYFIRGRGSGARWHARAWPAKAPWAGAVGKTSEAGRQQGKRHTRIQRRGWAGNGVRGYGRGLEWVRFEARHLVEFLRFRRPRWVRLVIRRGGS